MSSMFQVRDAGGSSRKSKALIAVVVLVVLAGILLATRHEAAKPLGADPAAAAVIAPLELAPADVATVAAQPLSRRLPLSGSVQPVNQATLKSKVSGDVLEMTVREGQLVHKGQMLARVDIRTATANNDNARASLDKAKADLAIAKLNYENSVKLLDQKFISQNAVDSSKATYDATIAVAKAAEASLRLSGITLEDATIRAPFDGVIAKRSVQVGEKVSPDSPVFTLVDLGEMELDAPAPTSEIPAIKVGQLAKFHVDGFADREFSGKVWRINPVAEPGSRSIMIYLTVPNVDGALKGGMFAQGELSLDAGTPVPAIPLAALHEDGGISSVWVIENGAAQRRDVTPGLTAENSGLVEIKNGLKLGEQVIVAHVDTLKNGTKLTLVGSDASPKSAAK